MSELLPQPGGFEANIWALTELRQAGLGRTVVELGKPAHNRSGRHSFVLRGRLDFDLSLGFGSGVASPARPGKSGAAGVRICGRRRATQPKRQRQRREYGKQ
jgi:hypothetical protein